MFYNQPHYIYICFIFTKFQSDRTTLEDVLNVRTYRSFLVSKHGDFVFVQSRNNDSLTEMLCLCFTVQCHGDHMFVAKYARTCPIEE
jgi:hypothetical protein